MKVAEGIKIVNQLTLSQRDYPILFGYIQYNQQGPLNMKVGNRKVIVKGHCHFTLEAE